MKEIIPNKLLFLFLISFGSLSLFGQKVRFKRYHVDHCSNEIFYTQKKYQTEFGKFITNLNSNDVSKNPIIIGLQHVGRSEMSSSNSYILDNAQSFSLLLPHSFRYNDSTRLKITGFNFGMHLLGWDLLSKFKNVDFITAFGFNTGMVWLFGNANYRLKNAYFSPKITMIPRFTIKRFVISFTGEYDYDISSKRWKNMWFAKKSELKPISFRQSSYAFAIGIGYKLN